MFRKRINWFDYIKGGHDMSENEMIVASKYFTSDVYSILSLNGTNNEEFIILHKDEFN